MGPTFGARNQHLTAKAIDGPNPPENTRSRSHTHAHEEKSTLISIVFYLLSGFPCLWRRYI